MTDNAIKDFGSLAVGVRVGRFVDPVFFVSWTRYLTSAAMRTHDRVLTPAIDLPHHWAACSLAHQFLYRTQCDTLMMLDDDMVFEPGCVNKMRDNPDNWPFDMVQALCVSRKPPHAPMMLKDVGGERFAPMRPDAGDKTFPVGMCGLAFTLIRREAMEKVVKDVGKGRLLFPWGETGRGEDGMFCEALRKVGGTLGIDTTLAVGHRTTLTLEWDTEKGATTFDSYIDNAFASMLNEDTTRKGD